MATRLESAEPDDHPTPASDAPAWAPDEGMVFDTVLVREERTAWVTVERPKSMPTEQVKKVLHARRESIAQSAAWWESTPVTTIVEIRLEANEPDDPNRKPVTVTPEDVAAPPPIKVTKG